MSDQNTLVKINPECQLPETCVHANRGEHIRDGQLQRKYGIDLRQFANILALQENICPICKDKIDDEDIGYVDWNGYKVRGILHQQCIQDVRAVERMGNFLEDVIKYINIGG